MFRKAIIFSLFCILTTTWAAEDISVELQWEALPGAKSYELEILDTNGKVLRNVKSKIPLIQFSIQAGLYTMRSRALDSRGVPGAWSALEELKVTPPTPKIHSLENTPSSVQVNSQNRQARIPIKWADIPSAEEYEVQIQDKNGKITKIKTEKSESEITLDPGVYQYRILAKSQGFLSEPTTWSHPVEVVSTPLTPPSLPDFSENEPPEFIQVESSIMGATLDFELERKWHLDEKWLPVDKKLIQIVDGKLNLWQWEPGLYRLKIWSKLEGWPDSLKVERYFIAKPTEESLRRQIEGL